MTRALLAMCAVLASCAGGCGQSSPSGAADAGSGGADAGLLVAEPDIPWLAAGAPPVARPSFTCPAGWREVHPIDDAPDVVTCDPWPTSGHATCTAVDEAHFPGEPGCARIGPACPVGDWAEDLPSGRPIRYVLAGAAAGGEGTMARPFARISEARTGAVAGTVIALAKGRYDATVSLGSGMALWGACVAETSITSGIASDSGVVTATSSGTELRNVHIDSPARPAITVDGGSASLVVEGVRISAPTHVGIWVLGGAMVTLRSVVLLGAREEFGDGFDLSVEGGSSLEASRAIFGSGLSIGLSGAGTMRMTDFAIVDEPLALGSLARLGVFDGANVTLERFSVAADPGLTAIQVRDAHVELVDGVAHGMRIALGTLGASTSVMTRRQWYRDVVTGVLVDAGTTVLEDTVIAETRREAMGAGGHAMVCRAGLVARRAFLSDCAGTCAVMEPGCTAELADVEIAGGPSTTATPATSFAVTGGAVATVTRLVVRGASDNAVEVHGAGSMATVSDLLVTDAVVTLPCRPVGVLADDMASLELERAVVERAPQVGVLVANGASLRGSDVVTRDLVPCEGQAQGRGIFAQRSGSIELVRARVERARELAVGGTSGATVTLTDVAVVDTLAAACAESTCPERPGATGLFADRDTTLRVTRFIVDNAALCGALVATTGQMDLMTGDVGRSAIGACVQSDGYDVLRLSNDVRYHDNGVNLQATSLPLPMAIDLGAP